MFVLFYGIEVAEAENLKFSIIKIHASLSLCFTLSLTHGHLPPTMYATSIVPIVINESVILSDSNTYRPIELATIVYKMFGSVLLFKCAEYLQTSDINLISHLYNVMIYVFIP